MRTYDIPANEENIVQMYECDAIKRNMEITSFITLLNELEGPFSIAVDGKWGSGKTFFVKQAKLVMDCNNPNINESVDNNIKNRIKSAWSKYKGDNEELGNLLPQVTVYYDAWEHDNEDDPILSLAYEIVKEISWCDKPEKSREWGKIFAEVATVFSAGRVPNLSDAITEFKGEDIFDKQKNRKNLKESVDHILDSILPEKGERLVIFIDELDRCSPDYAVLLLERVKHYFNHQRISFVFSINSTELQHTIKKYYGSDFDSSRYLDRFFDLRVGISSPNLQDYIRLIGGLSQRNLREAICEEVIKQMHLELREISRYIQLSKIAASKYTDSDSNSQRMFLYDNGNARTFGLCVVVPIAIALKITDTKQFDLFVNGKDSSWLVKILNSEDVMQWCAYMLLDNDPLTGKMESDAIWDDRIKQAYKALFVNEYDGKNYQTKVGKAVFTMDEKNIVQQAIGLVSKYSVYK